MAWRNAILAATATLALAACSKPAGEKAASAEGAAKPATATAPAAGPAAMPNRKPGLWKQTVSTAGMTQTSTICLDKAVESKLAVWGAGASKDMCKQTAMAPTAGGWTFASTCDMGTGGTTTTKGTVTGDFDTSYKVEASSVTEGAGAPQAADLDLQPGDPGGCVTLAFQAVQILIHLMADAQRALEQGALVLLPELLVPVLIDQLLRP